MIARVAHAVMAVLAMIAAYLQLNDPDPVRWVALYLGCAAVALCYACGRPAPRLALGMALVAAAWAAAIVPELIGRWGPGQLLQTMVPNHPEIEYGREFGGLVIVASYCALSYLRGTRHKGEHAPA
jgi:hypothetical protein